MTLASVSFFFFFLFIFIILATKTSGYNSRTTSSEAIDFEDMRPKSLDAYALIKYCVIPDSCSCTPFGHDMF